jgi:peptidylprolyl isomerase
MDDAATSNEKPIVTIPDGDAPEGLVIEDLIDGAGAEAVAGRGVVVDYVGVAWSTKAQFDASWDRQEPFEFQLGAGQVIAGWDQGVVGMKEGGRRRLTIPADMGYGSRGAGGVIKGGETLVFVVDLITVR